MTKRPMTLLTTSGIAVLFAILAGCGKPASPPAATDAAGTESAPKATSPDLAGLQSPDEEAPAEWAGKELPSYMIPNIPQSAEAYYAPDNIHVIAQTKDPTAAQPEPGKIGGSLTFTYTDTGEELTRINDKGQDACSWFLPDGKGVIFTSTRDNLDMPPGNWSEETDYPQGAELYTSDLKGGNIKRLTNNKYYEAEVTTSLDGKWVFFGRQIDGKLDIWKMRIDGTDEQQLTFTPDWQEGAPYSDPGRQAPDLPRLEAQRQAADQRGVQGDRQAPADADDHLHDDDGWHRRAAAHLHQGHELGAVHRPGRPALLL